MNIINDLENKGHLVSGMKIFFIVQQNAMFNTKKGQGLLEG